MRSLNLSRTQIVSLSIPHAYTHSMTGTREVSIKVYAVKPNLVSVHVNVVFLIYLTEVH